MSFHNQHSIIDLFHYNTNNLKRKFTQYKAPSLADKSITIWKFCRQGFTPAASSRKTNGGAPTLRISVINEFFIHENNRNCP